MALNKFPIQHQAKLEQENSWLIAEAETKILDGVIHIEHMPTISSMNKSFFTNQDTIVGGMFILVLVFSLYFLFKVSSVILAGNAMGDEKKIVVVMIVFALLSGMVARHFFTKSPDRSVVDIEMAKIEISQDAVKYRFKLQQEVQEWSEPRKNYKGVGYREESISRGTLSGALSSSNRVPVNVIYVEHKHQEDKSLALKVQFKDQDIESSLNEYAQLLSAPNLGLLTN